MIRGTTSSTSISDLGPRKFKLASESGTVLAAKADVKEVEADRDTGAGAGAFLVALAVDFFLAEEEGWER